jgi:hypothetical protein
MCTRYSPYDLLKISTDIILKVFLAGLIVRARKLITSPTVQLNL